MVTHTYFMDLSVNDNSSRVKNELIGLRPIEKIHQDF